MITRLVLRANIDRKLNKSGVRWCRCNAHRKPGNLHL